MSIIEVDCARASTGLICAHIEKFYPAVGGKPPVFCIFSDAELPDGYSMTSTPSDTGDDCHREVDASNRQLKKMRERPRGGYSTCVNGEVRAVNADDIATWKELYA